MKLLAPLKKFILFPRRGYPLTRNSRLVTIFLFYLPSSLPPRRLRTARPISRLPPTTDSTSFPLHLASYRGGNRLMYLQQPIPIVIPGYDLRLRRFDCQISSPFAFAYTLKCCRAPEITHRWDFYGAFSFPVENS